MDNLKQRGVVLLPEDFSADWIKMMQQSGLNTLKMHTLQRRNSLEAFMDSPAGKKLLEDAAAAGIDVEYEVHCFAECLSRDIFESRPEWFRMNNRGWRTPDKNFCISNQGALDFLIKNAVKFAQKYKPTTSRYYLWGDDGGQWCHCPKCAGLSNEDQNITVMNSLAEALGKNDSQAKVAYLAYQNVAELPTIKPNERIFLEWAPIKRCYRHKINDPSCAVNRKFNAELLKLLKFFDPADTQILEYWLDASLFSGWKLPAAKIPVDTEIIRSDIEYYRSLGVYSIASFACFVDADYIKAHGEPPLNEYANAMK